MRDIGETAAVHSPRDLGLSKLCLSERAGLVLQSEIRAMSIACERVGGINLSQGICDLEVPQIVRAAAQRAIDDGFNIYTRCDGLLELRQAIAKKVRRFGIEANPEGEVVVTAGSTGALYCACMALLNPGDEVIVFEPFYGYHVQTLLAVDLVPRYVRLEAPTWNIDAAALERVVSKRTRGIIINTPANPTGKVLTRAELQLLADFAEAHDLFVFTDEIYEHFVYEGEHIPFATLPGMRERTITISGVSKTFSITGWRIGYAICEPRWAAPISHFHDLLYVCAPAPLQKGVAAGLEGLPDAFYADIQRTYGGKRDRLCATLTRAGLTPSVPGGAYYVLADVSRLPGEESKARAMHLLDVTGVATVPGKAFFADPNDGAALTRFCFAKSDADLDEACRRLWQLG